MVFGHRITEREAGGFLVVGQDVRNAEGVAPNLDAVADRLLTRERRLAREEHRGRGGGDGRRSVNASRR